MIIGLDTGGTHIDAVLIEDGKIIDWVKHPTNRKNLLGSILETLKKLIKDKDSKGIEKVNLSTTISTNAIIEGKTSPVAMFIEGGPGIDPKNFSCGDYIVFLDGYIDHRGREIKPCDKEVVYKEIKHISLKKVKAASVVTKFSTRNLSHEKEIAEILIKSGFTPVTMGHSISGKLSFPRRIYTAYLNSTIYDTFNEFSNAIKKALKSMGINVPINILKADGGTLELDEASKFPVQTILSGPAASVMGSISFFDLNEDAILLDIGGTTTDISFLAKGIPLLVPDGITISGYPTLVRAVYNVSVGLGGDSCVKINGDGEITVGPERKGSPMALGGPNPTPSDAMIVLGKMDFGSKEMALKSMELLGNKLNTTSEKAAQMVYDTFGEKIKEKVQCVLREINSHPVYTIHELLYGKKIEPKSVIVIGGPAKAFTPIIEKKLNIPCRVPQNYQVANAIGAALARQTFEISLLADTERGKLSVPEIGLYKNIESNYDIKRAKKDAISLLVKYMEELGSPYSPDNVQIVEESCFNMVRGFYTSGKNIRIRAQIKPGITQRIGGENNA